MYHVSKLLFKMQSEHFSIFHVHRCFILHNLLCYLHGCWAKRNCTNVLTIDILEYHLHIRYYFVSCVTVRRQPTCGDQDYLTDNNGEIISHSGYNVGHNYGKNQDCVWKVEAPEGLNVQLTPITFDLESDISYVNQWIIFSVYD